MAEVEWKISDTLIDYDEAVAFMEDRAAEIFDGRAPELVWLLEHPPLYTAGTSANSDDLLAPDRFPVYKTGRGGEYTYHGPGQRVAYVMMNLNNRTRDVRAYVRNLEEWIIQTLGEFSITGERREGRVGIWVDRGANSDGTRNENKIAAIGVRVRRWVTFHGISINVEPELEHFSGIVPCGIAEHGVTSLVDLGIPATTTDVDVALQKTFSQVFDGPRE
jgi:lipoyl(octanoyl) transferase